MSIIIVGLGSGDKRYLTLEAWDVLSKTAELYVRTVWHPVIDELPKTIQIISFDHLYDTAETFSSVYAQIVESIIQAGTNKDIVYAVPGHPFVGESTTKAIIQEASKRGTEVQVIEGLSFVEPTLTAVNLFLAASSNSAHLVDGMDHLQVCDALELLEQDFPKVHVNMPVLVGQVYSQAVASELKLKLTAVYDDETPVYLVHGASTTKQSVEAVYLYEIDRSATINHLTSLYIPALPRPGDLTLLAEVVATLRGPNGCPWDQEQTPQSMRSGFLEEAYEVLEALDLDDEQSLQEELGDMLLHIVMQVQMASEVESFKLTDVIAGIVEKLIRRHPHIWGDVKVKDSAQVVQNWESIKAQEKGTEFESKSILDNIPNRLPALAQSQKIQERVAKEGFDWQTIDGVYAKLHEEVNELQASRSFAEKQMELGDVLFVVVNLGKWLGIDSESALREANLRFSRRFRKVETLAEESGLVMRQMSEDDLIALWLKAKALLADLESTYQN